MWESKVNISEIKELRFRTTAYFGVGALSKTDDILREFALKGFDKVLVVSDKVAYKVTGIWEKLEPLFKKNNVNYVVYDDVAPNPTVDQIDDAVKIGKEFGANAVIGIGGGSPIDVCKSVAILLEYKDKTARDLYELKFVPEKAVPIVAINTTHGTGTEVDRFAVASIPEKDYKPAIAYDCIYPTYAIDDPEVMKTLPLKQTIYTSIDAVNHVTEAATAISASPYTVLLAKETIRLVAKYLPQAITHPDDLTARYYLLYASTIAGVCFDNGLLHFTHALEHPLSAIKPDLPHGLGLAMLLPAVLKAIYNAVPEVLAELYAPIIPDLKGRVEEAEKVFVGLERWLFNLGITEKLADEGFKKSDIDKLVELAFTTPSLDLLLSVAPIKATKDVVKSIYEDSFKLNI